ncbi:MULTISPECIES: CdaR family transcriptional regulator [unclassified Pseudonocardia]|uniref:PucR family transcriptional regulator n=1 Tax=unclassified Pseudonocardia TaxID=2619320 RepID=UPI00094AAC3F|nr:MULTISPECIES: helix-turn-helix domain-containing protein [unclassified Pseudonocardia]
MATPLGTGPPPVRRPGPVLVPEPSDPLPRLLAGLSAAVLSGVDDERLVDRVSGLLGLPVTLRRPDLRVRTWAAPTAFRLDAPPALPSSVLGTPGVSRLGPGWPSVVLPPDPVHGPARRHLLAVLVAEGAVAGYLDVGELGRALRPSDAQVAEQAAAVLSVRLAGEARTERAIARNRDDVLADLLRGTRPEPDLRRLAGQVGLDLDTGHVLLRFPVAPGRSASGSRDAVVAAAGAALGAAPPVLVEPDAVVGLVALSPDPSPGELRSLHRSLLEGLDAVVAATGVRRIVVSGAVREIGGFPAALAETREVDGIAGALGGAADVVAVTELSTLRLVVNADRAGVAVRFAEQYLGPLRRNDESSGGDLVETLRRYLAAGAQVRAAAKELGVHENTVRYRLGRIEHLTGLDTRRFDALLAAQLAFQVDGLATAGLGVP